MIFWFIVYPQFVGSVVPPLPPKKWKTTTKTLNKKEQTFETREREKTKTINQAPLSFFLFWRPPSIPSCRLHPSPWDFWAPPAERGSHQALRWHHVARGPVARAATAKSDGGGEPFSGVAKRLGGVFEVFGVFVEHFRDVSRVYPAFLVICLTFFSLIIFGEAFAWGYFQFLTLLFLRPLGFFLGFLRWLAYPFAGA